MGRKILRIIFTRSTKEASAASHIFCDAGKPPHKGKNFMGPIGHQNLVYKIIQQDIKIWNFLNQILSYLDITKLPELAKFLSYRAQILDFILFFCASVISLEIPISDITIIRKKKWNFKTRLYEKVVNPPRNAQCVKFPPKLEICVNTYKFSERLALAYCGTIILFLYFFSAKPMKMIWYIIW